ncbi:unnamed protein product [Owenia fusiformis]|uniref:Uncharacterized protein n=1 Tax=Owenia fusiformis TaxID=6347 RepID=A0A8J1Y0T3_OWEFU|nr:unnamed protein product [Owenia fusiformis]
MPKSKKRASKELVFCKLNEDRNSGFLCDVEILADSKSYNAHKVVLATHSQYFRTIFSSDSFEECRNNVISLNGLNSKAFNIALEYIYGRDVDFDFDVIFDVLDIAEYLCIPALKDKCDGFLRRQLSAVVESVTEIKCSVFELLCAADAYKLVKLKETTRINILRDFTNIYRIPEQNFAQISYEVLLSIISSSQLKGMESDILDAVLYWLVHNSDSIDLENITLLLEEIRFPLMSGTELASTISLLRKFFIDQPKLNAIALGYVDEAVMYQLKKESQSFLQSARTIPRYSNKEDIVYCISSFVPSEQKMKDEGVPCFICYVNDHDRWYTLAPPPIPTGYNSMCLMNQSSCVVICGILFCVFCPLTQGPIVAEQGKPALLVKYELDTNSWMRCADIPSNSDDIYLAEKNGNIIAMCMTIDPGHSDDGFYEYEAENDQWCILWNVPLLPNVTDLSQQPCDVGFTCVGDSLYVLGGQGPGNLMKLFQIFNLVSEDSWWQNKAPMLARYRRSRQSEAPRKEWRLQTRDDNILVLNAENKDNLAINIYRTKKDFWTTLILEGNPNNDEDIINESPPKFIGNDKQLKMVYIANMDTVYFTQGEATENCGVRLTYSYDLTKNVCKSRNLRSLSLSGELSTHLIRSVLSSSSET